MPHALHHRFGLLWVLIALGCGRTEKRQQTPDTSTADSGASDADGDGWPAGVDCDDADAAINPSAPEYCDDVDSNCDGDPQAGAVDAMAQWVDADGDGWPVADHVTACPDAPGALDNRGSGWDCDDTDPAVYPAAHDVCGNGVDENCDGIVDNPTIWYTDADGDRYGDASAPFSGCADSAPSGFVANTTDCDDGDPAVNPDGDEVWGNGVDDNCDGGDGVPGAANTDNAVRIEGPSTGNWKDFHFARVEDADGAGTQVLAAGGAGEVAWAELPLPPNMDDARSRLTGLDGGTGIIAAGDSDGNGVAELLVPGLNSGIFGMWVVENPPSGESALSDVATWIGNGRSVSNFQVAGGGDLDGDGMTDAVAAWSTASYTESHEDSPGTCDGGWNASILTGPIAAYDDLVQTPRVEEEYSCEGSFSRTGTIDAAILGDTDADGYDDIAVDFGDVVYLMAGPLSAAPVVGDAAAKFTGFSGVATVGDLDGDGRAELLASGGALVFAFAGPLAGAWDSSAMWANEAVVNEALAGTTSVVAGPDADGDGVRELWLGSSTVSGDGCFGRVADGHLEFGAATTLGDDGAWYGPTFDSGFGAAVAVGPFAGADDSLLIAAPDGGVRRALYLVSLD